MMISTTLIAEMFRIIEPGILLHETALPHAHPHPDPLVLLMAACGVIALGFALYHYLLRPD